MPGVIAAMPTSTSTTASTTNTIATQLQNIVSMLDNLMNASSPTDDATTTFSYLISEKENSTCLGVLATATDGTQCQSSDSTFPIYDMNGNPCGTMSVFSKTITPAFDSNNSNVAESMVVRTMDGTMTTGTIYYTVNQPLSSSGIDLTNAKFSDLYTPPFTNSLGNKMSYDVQIDQSNDTFTFLGTKIPNC